MMLMEWASSGVSISTILACYGVRRSKGEQELDAATSKSIAFGVEAVELTLTYQELFPVYNRIHRVLYLTGAIQLRYVEVG